MLLKMLNRLIIADEYGIEKYWRIRSKYHQSRGIVKRLHKNNWRKLMIRFNCFIPLDLHMDKTVVFPHGIAGVYISEGASIGSNCVIFQQVTIGSNTLKDSKNKGAPVIDKHCYIGAGAKIIGNVTIGKAVRIGANCAVTISIPDNCTVVSQKPLVIPHQQANDNSFSYWDSGND